jgi:hypothetical protein
MHFKASAEQRTVHGYKNGDLATKHWQYYTNSNQNPVSAQHEKYETRHIWKRRNTDESDQYTKTTTNTFEELRLKSLTAIQSWRFSLTTEWSLVLHL